MDTSTALLEYATICQIKDVYRVLFIAMKQNNEAVVEICTDKIEELKLEL